MWERRHVRIELFGVCLRQKSRETTREIWRSEGEFFSVNELRPASLFGYKYHLCLQTVVSLEAWIYFRGKSIAYIKLILWVMKWRLVVWYKNTVCGRERMSELSGFVYNKVHQKSREATCEIWRSEGSRWMNFDQYPYLGINISFQCKRLEAWFGETDTRLIKTPYQGCALAEPGGPWRLTFALVWIENLTFFSYKSYAGQPRFYRFRELDSFQCSLEHSLVDHYRQLDLFPGKNPLNFL